MNAWNDLWNAGQIFRNAFSEQQQAVREVYGIADNLLKVPEGTPTEYDVGMDPVPDSFFTLRRNIFSTLFQSTYHLLDCAGEHRLFYGKLIHLFRIWVTSADNLLDQEDKIVIPVRMAGSSRIMRQVVAIMTADRILTRLLSEETARGTLTAAQAQALSARSMQILLPSAAQEAGEEKGISVRPDPEYVLNTIHHYKTGILFNVAFLGPETVEPHLNRQRATVLKKSLLQFGIGCQVLDDIRDLPRDCIERRHNYLLSVINRENPGLYRELCIQNMEATDRPPPEVLPYALPAARLGFNMMRDGLQTLGEMGLGIRPKLAKQLAASMFTVLDLEDLCHA